jgi:nitronate monooxygenase
VTAVHTPWCDVLHVRLPIMNVGFGGAATAELAAAVSNAGACGVVGSAAVSPNRLRREIGRTRQLTTTTFGVNVILAGLSHPGWDQVVRAQLDVCVDERVPLIVVFWGDPAVVIDRAHAVGTKVIAQVGTVEEAAAAADAGIDAVIAQGVEAGGHIRGRSSTWELLPACVEAISPIPVLAAGGIGDGAGIARALRAGAQGVSLGTVFLGATEADVHPEYRQRVLDATGDDTVLTDDLFDVGWPDAPHRTLRGATFDEWDRHGRPAAGRRPGEGTVIGWDGPDRTAPVLRYSAIMATSRFEGDIELAPLWAGRSVDHVRASRPAADIVAELEAELTREQAADRSGSPAR